MIDLQCPHCRRLVPRERIPDVVARSLVGYFMQRLRRVHRGQPKKRVPCRYCAKFYLGWAKRREHERVCRKRPVRR